MGFNKQKGKNYNSYMLNLKSILFYSSTFLIDFQLRISNISQSKKIPKKVKIAQNGNIYYSQVGYTGYSTISDKISDLLE